MASFKIRKCVSLGGIGTPEAKKPHDPVADLAFGTNAPDLVTTRTPWVRLFAQWNFFAPTPLLPRNTTYPPFLQQQSGLDTNIAAAKRIPGQKVILTTRGFPGWVPHHEPPQPSPQYTFPLPSFLMPSASATPNDPFDGPYSQWVAYLMDRYHPSNPRRPDPRASIDYLEVVNEPNYEIGPGSAAVRATALMFNTAHAAAVSLNAKYPGQPIRLLGPGTSDSTRPPSPEQEYRTFTRALLDELDRLPGVGMHSRIFGWSHHNYKAVEHIAKMLRGVSAAVVTEVIDVSRRLHLGSPDGVTPDGQALRREHPERARHPQRPVVRVGDERAEPPALAHRGRRPAERQRHTRGPAAASQSRRDRRQASRHPPRWNHEPPPARARSRDVHQLPLLQRAPQRQRPTRRAKAEQHES